MIRSLRSQIVRSKIFSETRVSELHSILEFAPNRFLLREKKITVSRKLGNLAYPPVQNSKLSGGHVLEAHTYDVFTRWGLHSLMALKMQHASKNGDPDLGFDHKRESENYSRKRPFYQSKRTIPSLNSTSENRKSWPLRSSSMIH